MVSKVNAYILMIGTVINFIVMISWGFYLYSTGVSSHDSVAGACMIMLLGFLAISITAIIVDIIILKKDFFNISN